MESSNRRQGSVDRQTVWNRWAVHSSNSPARKPTLCTFRVMAFGLMHVACVGVFFTGTSALALLLCGVVYLLQMIGITVGYHRYFSHRTFKTGRALQFALACLGCSASQRGPIWWAAQHRHHHRTSDTPEDLHSPVAHTFWQSHVAWIFSPQAAETNEQTVKDLIRYPELRWLDRLWWLPPLTLAALCWVVGGWAGLVWGFFVSSILSHHATFLVNSVCHVWGTRSYATSDSSRNNWFVALITLGEGWHNNHHHYPNSAQQGFRWWEYDIGYYLIRLLARLGFVYDVRKVPKMKLLESPPDQFASSEKCDAQPIAGRHGTYRFECATVDVTSGLNIGSSNGQDRTETPYVRDRYSETRVDESEEGLAPDWKDFNGKSHLHDERFKGATRDPWTRFDRPT